MRESLSTAVHTEEARSRIPGAQKVKTVQAGHSSGPAWEQATHDGDEGRSSACMTESSALPHSKSQISVSEHAWLPSSFSEATCCMLDPIVGYEPKYPTTDIADIQRNRSSLVEEYCKALLGSGTDLMLCRYPAYEKLQSPSHENHTADNKVHAHIACTANDAVMHVTSCRTRPQKLEGGF